ncbi:DUF1707 SHOCT-like domain-containing protein [Pseudonocardia sp. GCM10023141]|uniref:DUF1707 SHOCT-like domain-containing protein n=1 Tax=Pseudonocardia sp. GCM10023141 TaxID=3252653 RepID=UPI00361FDD73
MSDCTPARDLRVSHAEREHVAELLARQLAAGRLTPDEYTGRLGVANAAVTRADLNSVLIDLPGARLSPDIADDVLTIAGRVGDLQRSGHWVVPATVAVSTWVGNVRLDFTEARFTTTDVTVDLNVGAGNVDLVLPPGATVDLDQVRAGIGLINDRTAPAAERGTPHIEVVGSTRCGTITVKHSTRPRPYHPSGGWLR